MLVVGELDPANSDSPRTAAEPREGTFRQESIESFVPFALDLVRTGRR